MAVAAWAVRLFLGSSAICDGPFVAVLSDEADMDIEDSSVLLLPLGDNGRSAVVPRFC